MKLSDITVVTSNKYKIAEINSILGTNHKVSTFDIPEIQSMDLDEVITAKVKEAYKLLKKPVMVEDVSVDIKALKGFPGPLVKFFVSVLGADGIAKLLINKNTNTEITASVALYNGCNLKIIKEKIKGKIADKPRGSSGFGFDPIFIPNGHTKTFAQLTKKEKNKISHRGKVLQKVKKYLS